MAAILQSSSNSLRFSATAKINTGIPSVT
jgi:hypothetical protein